MAVSNQLRTTKKKVKAVAPPPALGDARSQAPASGLNKVGVPAAIALKSKKISRLNLKGVSNY